MEKIDYKKEKEQKKQKLARNEFLYHGKSEGRYEFPVIHKQNIDVSKIKFLSYVNSKKEDEENKDKTIHFFTYDWLFEKVYENADVELEKLKQYYCLLSPDFSLFTNMPLALQIENVFKNRWCGAYWQSKGINVIPTVSWGDEKSFEFCFDGIEEGSIVAVCTYYRENDENSFMLGYNKMLEKIKPSIILCYDEPFKSMKGNIVEFLPTTYEWINNLDWKEKTQFYFEKHNRNVIGLNPKDFKYFDYDDPYKKDIVTNCPVCGKMCMIDKYGNGECDNWGWILNKNWEKDKYKVTYPNMVSLLKARKLYKEGKKFLPDLDDFIQAMKMYSEMTFYYENREFGVIYYAEGDVEFFEVDRYSETQKLKSVEEFRDKASIDGKLLKNIWSKVKNADYMQ